MAKSFPKCLYYFALPSAVRDGSTYFPSLWVLDLSVYFHFILVPSGISLWCLPLCNSLMTKDVKNLFMCLSTISVFSLVIMSAQNFGYFFKIWDSFLLIEL